MTTTRRCSDARTLALVAGLALGGAAVAHPDPQDGAPAPASSPAPTQAPAWRSAEADTLKNHVRITLPSVFHKAGEAYFDPYARWIVFQGVPLPPEGQEPDKHYAMYVGRTVRNPEGGILGVESYLEISPPGSANTCGFFDPKTPYRVLFGSTLQKPFGETEQGGFKRDRAEYVWEFPRNMDIVRRTVPAMLNSYIPNPPKEAQIKMPTEAVEAEALWEDDGYDAELSMSRDSRFIVYAHVNPETNDADIWVHDLKQLRSRRIVQAPGYDGGPFFSPDWRYICYRSDRQQNGHLQVYVARLKWDTEEELDGHRQGTIIGVEWERPVTANDHVNWAPFWHPSGEWLVYTTSEHGHDNYEVYMVEAPIGEEAAPPESLRRKRITNSPGFDGLPAFSADGRFLMWTSQREPDSDAKGSSQVWIAETVNILPQ